MTAPDQQPATPPSVDTGADDDRTEAAKPAEQGPSSQDPAEGADDVDPPVDGSPRG